MGLYERSSESCRTKITRRGTLERVCNMSLSGLYERQAYEMSEEICIVMVSSPGIPEQEICIEKELLAAEDLSGDIYGTYASPISAEATLIYKFKFPKDLFLEQVRFKFGNAVVQTKIISEEGRKNVDRGYFFNQMVDFDTGLTQEVFSVIRSKIISYSIVDDQIILKLNLYLQESIIETIVKSSKFKYFESTEDGKAFNMKEISYESNLDSILELDRYYQMEFFVVQERDDALGVEMVEDFIKEKGGLQFELVSIYKIIQ
jgi:hypothetical protein